MGPERFIADPPGGQFATVDGLTVRTDHHPRPVDEPGLVAELEQAAPGRGPALADLADQLHTRHNSGSRLGMLEVVLAAVTLGCR